MKWNTSWIYLYSGYAKHKPQLYEAIILSDVLQNSKDTLVIRTKMMVNLSPKNYQVLYYNQNPCLRMSSNGLTDTMFLWPIEPGWKWEIKYLTITALIQYLVDTLLLDDSGTLLQNQFKVRFFFKPNLVDLLMR